MYEIEYLDDNMPDKKNTKTLTSRIKPNAKNVNSETSNEIIQAKKCLEVAKLLMKADQMVKKRICQKTFTAKKK